MEERKQKKGRDIVDYSAIRVREDRLRRDLEELGKFGEEPGGGILRPALSPADLEARRWFKGRMEEAGLEVHEDGAANIIGRLKPTSCSSEGPCIATGSHIDAVLQGGKFDGALGICAGLEAFRAIKESGLSIPRPLELLVFTDEEGSHFAGTFGSRAMFNLLTEGEIFKSKGSGSPSLAESLQRMGKDPENIGRAIRPPSDFLAFLELHIEQGPVLDSRKIPIGIVQAIVAIDRYLLHVEGRSGHAGTTPMHLRDDALVKAARMIPSIHGAVRLAGAGTVGTIGELKVYPGAFNIIPGKVEMTLDLRSMNKPALRRVRKKIREIVGSIKGARMETILSKDAALMDRRIMSLIELSCKQRGIRSLRMGSGAGHDAMTFSAQGIPTGMIFIPCEGGKSHCPEEAIRWEDATLGAQILADTMMRLAYGASLPRR